MTHILSTKDRLAHALELAGAPAGMVSDARAGKFDDFEADVPNPITVLVRLATSYGLLDIAERARNGEWDATADEAEAWAARQPPATRAMLDALLHIHHSPRVSAAGSRWLAELGQGFQLSQAPISASIPMADPSSTPTSSTYTSMLKRQMRSLSGSGSSDSMFWSARRWRRRP